MISTRQLAGALYGLWLLYRFDVRAWDFFDKTPRGFWASYVVAFALAPLQLAHIALLYSARDASLPFLAHMIVQVLAYILNWVLFPFVMLYISRLLEREGRYLWHMVPYIWMLLPLALLQLFLLVLTDLQILPGLVIAFFGPIIIVAQAVYATFVAAIGLQVVTGTALSLVVLDFILTLIVSQLVSRI